MKHGTVCIRTDRWIRLAESLLCCGVLGVPGRADEGVLIPPEVSLGWVQDAKDSDWTLHRQASTSTAGWERSGWRLEVRTGARLGPRQDLLLEAGWFLPQPASGTWKTSPGSVTYAFDVPSYRWGALDGLFRFHLPQDRVHLLAGARWDSKRTRVHYEDGTDDIYRLNTYAPMLGIAAHQPVGSGDLSVRVLYSPLVRGRMEYRFWVDSGGFEEHGDFRIRRGSTLECRAQYTRSVGERSRVGGFAQWGFQRVTSETSALEGGTTERVSWRVSHRTWTVGLTASF